MSSDSKHDAEQPPRAEEEDRPEGQHEDDDGESEEESDDDFVIESDEVAAQVRSVAITAFNEGRLEEALKIQFALLKRFTTKFGETDPKCAPYYLDYGITLLSLVQTCDAEAAALAGNTGQENEDVEICHVNLELARVCYDKLEDECDAEEELKAIQVRQAEVHEALSQVHRERDDDHKALEELEFALLLRQNALAANDRAIVCTMFEIGLLYLRNEELDKAESMMTDTLALAKTCPNLPAEMIDDVQQYIDEAKELKEQGGMDKVKEEIRTFFPGEEHSQALEAAAATAPAPAASTGLLAAVPRELALLTAAAPFMGGMVASRENSSSLSFFPRQVLGDASRGASFNMDVQNSGAVNTAVAVRRKERPRPVADEDAEKRHRADDQQ